MIISDFDGGKKGSFTEAESVALKKGAFDRMSPAAVALVSSDSIGTIVSIEKTKVKAERPCQFMPDQIVLWMKRKSRNA